MGVSKLSAKVFLKVYY